MALILIYEVNYFYKGIKMFRTLSAEEEKNVNDFCVSKHLISMRTLVYNESFLHISTGYRYYKGSQPNFVSYINAK